MNKEQYIQEVLKKLSDCVSVFTAYDITIDAVDADELKISITLPYDCFNEVIT